MGSESGTQSVPINLAKQVTDFIPVSVDPPNASTILAKADSGASSYYFRTQDQLALTNIRHTPCGPSVLLPDSTTIQATHTGHLQLHPSLSTKAQTAHVLEDISNASLVSLRQLCDDHCIAVLDTKKLQVFKDTVCVLQGDRNQQDGLWDIELPIPVAMPKRDIKLPIPTALPKPNRHQGQHHLNAIIRRDLSKTQLVQ